MSVRQIVLDTETTGLDPKLGHRIIEIACVELVNRRLTQNNFHLRFNPEREIDGAATAIHGMTWDDLKDKPRFADRAQQLLDFIRDAELVIHNAAFDVAFLDAELAAAGLPPLSDHCEGVLDTLRLAKELHPGKRNSLDVLCERYAVDNSGRTLHGALLDAELLADVYLAMTRGQDSLAIGLEPAEAEARAARAAALRTNEARAVLRVISAQSDELAEHADYLAALERETKRPPLWSVLLAEASAAAEAVADAADAAAAAISAVVPA
jgi:DNA polymerase-3 subunit epsilon